MPGPCVRALGPAIYLSFLAAGAGPVHAERPARAPPQTERNHLPRDDQRLREGPAVGARARALGGDVQVLDSNKSFESVQLIFCCTTALWK